ncbi:MAG: protein jag [Clostridiales bacterium]|nr:protein jag [Clostridiales bacterium]
MLVSIEATGKTEEEAIQNALNQLGLQRDDVTVEIIERAKSGFLGLKSTPAVVRVSYERPDTQSERVEQFLTGLFERMGVNATPHIREEEDGVLSVTLTGDDPGALIGRRGETLDAIQHLTNYVINKKASSRVRVNIDAENYRARRNEALEKLANKVAAKVVKYRRNMTLEPMNSYERHVIHTALQGFPNVTTYSVGSEPNRRIVIAYDKSGSGSAQNLRERR